MPRPQPQSGLFDGRAVFEILVREHADMLEVYLRSLIGRDTAVIDDLFQEAMLVAWRRLPDYDRTRPFAPWLRGIAHTLFLEHARKSRVRPITTDPEIIAQIDRRLDALSRGPGDTFREKADRMLLCLTKLPESMREAIDLVYMRKVPFAAAAQAQGSTKEAFWKRVQRGRLLLADCLGVGENCP